jgi:hypothetical protein
MEHPFLVEEYIPAQARHATPKSSGGFGTAMPEPESLAALPPFPNLPLSEALLLTPADTHYADYLPAANLRTQLAPALRAVCKNEHAVAVMTDWVRSNNLSFAPSTPLDDSGMVRMSPGCGCGGVLRRPEQRPHQ